MTLKEYLTTHGIKQAWFAKQIPCTPDSLNLHINNHRTPKKERRLRIEELTGGLVDHKQDWNL